MDVFYVAVAWALIIAIRPRGPPDVEPWKLALVAVVIAWFVQANFAPVTYAFDNYVPWLFAGIALAGTTSARAPAGDLTGHAAWK